MFHLPKSFFRAMLLALCTVTTPALATTVVEFYNTNLDNYFITADANEAAQIDSGSAGPGWIRTGDTFDSGGSTSVCRFYGSQSPGPNSHFYTVDANECEGLKKQQAATPATDKRWNFESLDFVSTPPTDGTCSAGTVPVYRAYNNGSSRGIDSNHRITTNLTAIQEVMALGWSSEGVVMCAPSPVVAAPANDTKTTFSPNYRGNYDQTLKKLGESSFFVPASAGAKVDDVLFDDSTGFYFRVGSLSAAEGGWVLNVMPAAMDEIFNSIAAGTQKTSKKAALAVCPEKTISAGFDLCANKVDFGDTPLIRMEHADDADACRSSTTINLTLMCSGEEETAGANLSGTLTLVVTPPLLGHPTLTQGTTCTGAGTTIGTCSDSVSSYETITPGNVTISGEIVSQVTGTYKKKLPAKHIFLANFMAGPVPLAVRLRITPELQMEGSGTAKYIFTEQSYPIGLTYSDQSTAAEIQAQQNAAAKSAQGNSKKPGLSVSGKVEGTFTVLAEFRVATPYDDIRDAIPHARLVVSAAGGILGKAENSISKTGSTPICYSAQADAGIGVSLVTRLMKDMEFTPVAWGLTSSADLFQSDSGWLIYESATGCAAGKSPGPLKVVAKYVEKSTTGISTLYENASPDVAVASPILTKTFAPSMSGSSAHLMLYFNPQFVNPAEISVTASQGVTFDGFDTATVSKTVKNVRGEGTLNIKIPVGQNTYNFIVPVSKSRVTKAQGEFCYATTSSGSCFKNSFSLGRSAQRLNADSSQQYLWARIGITPKEDFPIESYSIMVDGIERYLRPENMGLITGNFSNSNRIAVPSGSVVSAVYRDTFGGQHTTILENATMSQPSTPVSIAELTADNRDGILVGSVDISSDTILSAIDLVAIANPSGAICRLRILPGGIAAVINRKVSFSGCGSTLFAQSKEVSVVVSATPKDGVSVKSSPFVLAVASPEPKSHSPASATLNQVTTFTYTGIGLAAGMGFTVSDCDTVVDLGGSSTSRSFSCIPRTAGVQTLTIRITPGGTALYNGTVTVTVPAVVTITASDLVASQSAAGQPITGSFTVAAMNTTANVVRVHAGSVSGGSTCYKNLATGTGEKSFSFNGDWTNQTGQSCASLLPAAGATSTVWFKVEASNSVNASMPTAKATVTPISANYSALSAAANQPPTVSSASAVLNADRSLTVTIVASDPEGGTIGVESYISNAGSTTSFNAGSKKTLSAGASGSTRTITWTAAEAASFMTAGQNYAVRVDAFDSAVALGQRVTNTITFTAAAAVAINVSGLTASQSGTGQAINGSFSVSGSSVSLVRVHAGSSSGGSYACYADLAASTGSKSFSFNGSWTTENGLSCAALLPGAGSTSTIYFKVEARDSTSNLANAGTAPVISASYTAAAATMTVTGLAASPSGGLVRNVTSTIQVTGTNISASGILAIQDAICTAPYGHTSTVFYQKCTPQLSGSKTLTVKTQPGGTVVYTINLIVL